MEETEHRDELEEVFEELYSQGEFDSSGGFTLSSEQALAKLDKFRLQEPYGYILNLVAAGVVGGAETIHLNWKTSRVEVELVSLVFSSLELENLFSNLLNPGHDLRDATLAELAVGVRGAQNLRLRRVEIVSGSTHLYLVGPSQYLEKRAVEEASTRILIFYSLAPTVLINRFFRVSELEMVRARCDLCPVPIFLNEMNQSDTLGGGGWSLIPTAPQPPEMPVFTENYENGWVSWGRNGLPGDHQRSLARFVVRGVTFTRPLKMGLGEVQATLWTNEVRKDLSQSGLVEDHRLLALLARIAESVDRAKLQWLRSRPSENIDKTTRTLLRQVARSRRTAADLSTALDLVKKLPASYNQQAALLTLLGRYREAERMLERGLADNDNPHVRMGRWLNLASVRARFSVGEARTSWERASQLAEQLHRERKPHLVALCQESRLWWDEELGEEEAWNLWNQARKHKSHLRPQHRHQISNLETGSLLGLRFGQPSQALELLERALELRRTLQGPGDPLVGQTLALLALVHHALENPTQAGELARQRLGIFKTVYGPSHPEVTASQALLAELEQDPDSRRLAGDDLAQRWGEDHPDVKALQAGHQPVICYRAWFHSRIPWLCPTPLRWKHRLAPAES